MGKNNWVFYPKSPPKIGDIELIKILVKSAKTNASNAYRAYEANKKSWHDSCKYQISFIERTITEILLKERIDYV